MMKTYLLTTTYYSLNICQWPPPTPERRQFHPSDFLQLLQDLAMFPWMLQDLAMDASLDAAGLSAAAGPQVAVAGDNGGPETPVPTHDR